LVLLGVLRYDRFVRKATGMVVCVTNPCCRCRYIGRHKFQALWDLIIHVWLEG
jgi:hypothetical protein